MLSLCTILKNKENNIVNCLQAVKDFIDEIIIVATGSIGATKERCFTYADNSRILCLGKANSKEILIF